MSTWHCCLWMIVLLCIRDPCEGLLEADPFDRDESDDSDPGCVALAVQGKCKDFLFWQNLLTHQHNTYQVDLIFLTFDTPADTCHDTQSADMNSTAMYGPNTTWASGRNLLAKAIYKKEQLMRKKYKYWIMSDTDVRRLRCHNCRHVEEHSMLACCFDLFVQFLLGPQQFAVVAINEFQQHPEAHNRFSQHECPDGMLNAFHRAAVPVLLPYNDALDHVSWWSSQEILFHLASGCVKGGVVTLGGYSFHHLGAEHAEYPRGLDHSRTTEIIKQDYWQLIPWPISSAEHELLQLQCMSDVAAEWKPRFTSRSRTSVWQESPAYEVCLTFLEPYFQKFMHSLPYTHISP